MELTNFIETHIVWSFLIGFFTLLFLIFVVCMVFFKDEMIEDYDDEPYKPYKVINDIEVDAETLDNVPRHNQED